MKPQKQDIPGYLVFSQNISQLNIDPHINDAYKFDVKPKLGTLAVDIYNLQPSDFATKPQLVAFYNDYVVQWWILLAVKRFLQIHGYNLTQFGLTKIKDPRGTFDQMTPNERVVQTKQIDHDADILYSEILNQTWTFDTVVYRKANDCSPSKGQNWGISGI